MSTAVKRACDACHRRKVKCQNAVEYSLLDKNRGARDDSINTPCRNCSSAQLACTYNAIPQKKGPKGSRAKVISELRETQRLSAKTQSYTATAYPNPSSVSLAATPGLLTGDIAIACIDFFFNNMYPTMPVLSRQRIDQDIAAMDGTLDTYCLLCSLCAFTMLQPGMSVPSTDPYNMPGANIITATLLLEEAMRVRKGYEYQQCPTLYAIATSYFIFACHYGLDAHDKAWACIREATTLIHLIHMNKEESYQAWDKIEASHRRRLFWLIYVTERAYALQHDRPLSLQATINPPSPADDPNNTFVSQLVDFCRLVSLFRSFDNSFVDLWIKTRTGCSSSLIAMLQKQQSDVIASLSSADAQFGDVTRNQQWLQSFTWKISVANGTVASNVDDAAAYQYSMTSVSREMLPLAASFSPQGATELFNSGLVETLLVLARDLLDVLSSMPTSSNPFDIGPRDHLQQLANTLAMLRIGEYQFTPLLLVKVHEILPRLANPMLQNSPENGIEIDLFDGFGNAGMGQSPYVPMKDFKTEESDSMSGVAASLQDVASPFVSSPAIQSLGPDFSHPLPDYSPLTDMVIRAPMASSSATALTAGGMSTGHQQIQPHPQSHQFHQQPQLSHQLPQPQQTLQAAQPMQALQPMQVQHQRHQPRSPPMTQDVSQQQTTSQVSRTSQQQQRPQYQQRIPPDPFTQQHVAQHYTPQYQHRHRHTSQSCRPVSIPQGINPDQGMESNMPMHARIDQGASPSSGMGTTSQPLGQPHNSMASILSSQFIDPSCGLGSRPCNTNKSTMRSRIQQSSNYGISVGDFQALQRSGSDMNSMSPQSINVTVSEMDYAVR